MCGLSMCDGSYPDLSAYSFEMFIYLAAEKFANFNK